MTIVTVPLAPLIGLLLGLIIAGAAYAADDGECVGYAFVAVICSGACILLASGLEALIKAGGA